MAKEKELDLIEVSPMASPPVCRIMDYGKYRYEQEKKARMAAKKAHIVEVKSVRISPGISEHDLGMKAKKASEFLAEGNKVNVELMLRGRAKYLDQNFLKERMERILKLISTDYKISAGPKKGPRGMTITLDKA